MRLINADELKYCRILKGVISSMGSATIKEINRNDIPTSYDLDKVLEELREYADSVAELGGNFLPEAVIKIVKGGGLNDRKRCKRNFRNI